MEALTGTLDLYTDQYRGASLMLGGGEKKLISRAAAGDIEAKLQLVKDYLDLVVEFAAGYSSETGKPFSQMVQVGASAVIKAADNFHRSQQVKFADHLRLELTRAMEGIV